MAIPKSWNQMKEDSRIRGRKKKLKSLNNTNTYTIKYNIIVEWNSKALKKAVLVICIDCHTDYSNLYEHKHTSLIKLAIRKLYCLFIK